MPARIDVSDLPAEVRAQLLGADVPRARRRSLSKDDVRTHALRVLSVVASLTRSERERVLRHALRVNDV